MAPRKRRRHSEARSALLAPPARTLPADLILEIVLRSDATTLIRCAAACRLLRRRILATAFIQQLQVSARGVVLAGLHARRNKRPHHRRKPVVSLVYPTTPAASSLVDEHLAPFVSRQATYILWEYDPLTSRRGLVLLRRRQHLRRRQTVGSDMCVYDPLTDASTFLSEPPNISSADADHNGSVTISYVLLTAADGIDIRCCSFLLLVATRYIHPIRGTMMRVQTAAPSSDAGGDISWGPISKSVCPSAGSFVEGHRGLAVLPGGVIHWISGNRNILRYDVRTGKLVTVKHPRMDGEHYLAMSADGRLRILAVERFMISVWDQLSSGAWYQGPIIDTEEKLESTNPKILWHGPSSLKLRFSESEEIKSNAVPLKINDQVFLLDVETEELREQEDPTSSLLFEVDIPARLRAMRRVFS